MKVYIVLEHPDGFGGTARDLSEIVHGVFFDQKRAEDFVKGMASYINSYEDQMLFFAAGRVTDRHDTAFFQIVEEDVVQ